MLSRFSCFFCVRLKFYLQLEQAAKLVADEVMQGVEDAAEIHDIQVTLRTGELAHSIRQMKVGYLKSSQISGFFL